MAANKMKKWSQKNCERKFLTTFVVYFAVICFTLNLFTRAIRSFASCRIKLNIISILLHSMCSPRASALRRIDVAMHHTHTRRLSSMTWLRVTQKESDPSVWSHQIDWSLCAHWHGCVHEGVDLVTLFEWKAEIEIEMCDKSLGHADFVTQLNK